MDELLIVGSLFIFYYENLTIVDEVRSQNVGKTLNIGAANPHLKIKCFFWSLRLKIILYYFTSTDRN